MKQKIDDFKKNKINLFSQERLKSYSLQEDKRDIEIQLKRHNNNLNLIQRITKDLALIEIGLRNILNFYMIEVSNNIVWIENYRSKTITNYNSIISNIKKRYPVDKQDILNNNQLLSNLTLGVIIKILKEKNISDQIFNFTNLNLKKYHIKNRNRKSKNNNRSRLTNKEKTNIMLSLLSDIRNRSFHWESLIKIRENGYPRLSTNEYNILTSIEADKIEIFLSDILEEIYK